MVHGPAAGLATVERLSEGQLPADLHRLIAVRAHLLELAGDRPAAIQAYRSAARATASIPERDYLLGRARALGG